MEKDIDNRKMVLENLEGMSPTDDQVIDMLLLLLNDWEVRAAVMKSVNRRKNGDNNSKTITQTTTKTGSS